MVLDNLSFNYDVDYFCLFFPQLVLAFTSAFTFYITFDSIVPYLDFISLIGFIVKSSKTKQLRMLSYSDSWSCCGCLGLVVAFLGFIMLWLFETSC